MLAKKFRLPIQSVLNKSGRTFRSRSFLIKAFLSPLDFNRFGVVISKKVSKLAVKRNLIKRMVLDLAKKFVYPVRSRAPQGVRSTAFGRAASNGVNPVRDREACLPAGRARQRASVSNGVASENKNKLDVLIIISPAMIKMEKTDIIKELDEVLPKIIKS